MNTILKVTIATVVGSVAALGMVATAGDRANAQSINSGWNYQYDAVGDGSGGSQYDIKGMAIGNDAIAFSGSSEAAPEPTTLAGAALGIAAIEGLKRARRRKAAAAS